SICMYTEWCTDSFLSSTLCRSITSMFLLQCHRDPRLLHSFPTRRSSDLTGPAGGPALPPDSCPKRPRGRFGGSGSAECARTPATDRKSTRLNSSYVSISYAVFCLKKKKYRSSRIITYTNKSRI